MHLPKKAHVGSSIEPRSVSWRNAAVKCRSENYFVNNKKFQIHYKQAWRRAKHCCSFLMDEANQVLYMYQEFKNLRFYIGQEKFLNENSFIQPVLNYYIKFPKLCCLDYKLGWWFNYMFPKIVVTVKYIKLRLYVNMQFLFPVKSILSL